MVTNTVAFFLRGAGSAETIAAGSSKRSGEWSTRLSVGLGVRVGRDRLSLAGESGAAVRSRVERVGDAGRTERERDERLLSGESGAAVRARIERESLDSRRWSRGFRFRSKMAGTKDTRKATPPRTMPSVSKRACVASSMVRNWTKPNPRGRPSTESLTSALNENEIKRPTVKLRLVVYTVGRIELSVEVQQVLAVGVAQSIDSDAVSRAHCRLRLCCRIFHILHIFTLITDKTLHKTGN